MLSRRKLIVGAGSTALLGTLYPSPLLAFDFGSVFGTVAGAVATGLFPGAAAALGGFELIRLVGNTADVVGHAGDLVTQTQQLETHFDSVLNQVSATLSTVQSFVQDCDNALKDIEGLIRQLPTALVQAFSEVQAATAFARLRADSANMAGYLSSKGSIVQNKNQIQSLTEKIVNDISTIDVLVANDLQAMMQVVPGIATWVQGYTAYNLLVPGDSRGTNPWDHQLVSKIASPRIHTVIQSVQKQHGVNDNLDTQIPFQPGVLYTFDGQSFAKSNRAFATQYAPGEIDSGGYYVVYPDGATPQLPQMPPGAAQPTGTIPGTPRAGDLCYLMSPFVAGSAPRIWWEIPALAPNGAPLEIVTAQRVAYLYPRMMASTLNNLTSFNQLTQGWQIFEHSVNTHLASDAQTKSLWTQLPVLT
jgi:hypothetical protein